MQVTTPRGRWFVPPDRAVWVPARLAHAIDVLADIDMRVNQLARLNVLEQVRQLRAVPLLHDAKPAPRVHGWIFGLHDGRIDVLDSGNEQMQPALDTLIGLTDTVGR